jgi:hypothetical protein
MVFLWFLFYVFECEILVGLEREEIEIVEVSGIEPEDVEE